MESEWKPFIPSLDLHNMFTEAGTEYRQNGHGGIAVRNWPKPRTTKRIVMSEAFAALTKGG